MPDLKEQDLLAKTSKTMKFIAQVPLMITAVVAGVIISVLLIIFLWRAGWLVFERYLRVPWN